MFGFTYTSRRWSFLYVLQTRQEELAYLVDMYCCRIENLDRDTSCSFTNIRYYCSKSTTTTDKLKGFCKSLYVMVL